MVAGPTLNSNTFGQMECQLRWESISESLVLSDSLPSITSAFVLSKLSRNHRQIQQALGSEREGERVKCERPTGPGNVT